MIKKSDAPDCDPKQLFAFAANLLNMRRKTIKNNLKAYQNADAALMALGIPPETRAETLAPATFLALMERL